MTKAVQKKHKGRNADGLTNKMQRSLAVLGPAESVWAGVQECVTQGIVTIDTFYHDWITDEKFVTALNAERERIQGALADRIKAQAMAHADGIFRRMVRIAMGEEKANQTELAAMQYVLDRAGIDAGGKKERGNLFAAIMVRIQNREASPGMSPDNTALANAAPTTAAIVNE